MLVCCVALLLFSIAIDGLAELESIRLQRHAITTAGTVRMADDIANGKRRGELPPLTIQPVPIVTATPAQ